jgi:serine/threonine protein kinase
VGYVIQALTGIGGAHLMGVVHRDLKPSNLFLANRADGGRLVKVLDFGISKATGGPVKQNLTTVSNMIGSPAYMSPEQVNLAPNIDARADIWAVGVILYQLLTGELPFASPNVAEVLAFILEKDPVPPSARRPDVPPGLEAVLARCLAKDVEHRFPSANELARALGPFGPWSAGAAGARAESTSEARSTDRGPALTAPGVWTQKDGAEAHAANEARRSPYLRMVGIGAVIGTLLLAVLVVAASRSATPREATAAPAISTTVTPTVTPVVTASPSASATAQAVATPPVATAVASSEPATPEAAPTDDPASASAAPSVLRPGQVRRPGLTRKRR